MARGVSISRVRMQFCGLDSNSYTPQYVPIGPYHVSCSSARIEKEKLCGVSFVKSLSDENTEGGIARLVEKLEPRARGCYGDGVGQLTPEQFSHMLLRDGCYLLLLFVNYVTGACGNGAPTASGCDDSAVVRDTVFLLENQIPLFVLEKIHEHVTGGASMSVLEDIAVSVQELLQAQLYISKKLRPAPPQSSHLLHLVHAYFQPTNLPPEMDEDTAWLTVTGRWRRAREYVRCGGVRFKRRAFMNGEEWTVLDVCLKRGTLWIPHLRVDSNTWAILRNLMALEEQITRRPVTAYCIFMSQVAGTVEDVKLLVNAGIVEHFLASDEQVAQGFANLCMGVVMDVDNLDRNYLKPIWHKLQERCQSRVFRFIGWFCRDQHLIMSIVFLMAVIVLVCQVTQTFYAVTGGGRGQRPKQ
uniref:Uncharacterized protein n=2 Tax=Hordeum vulgare subsp. vulgare TaxID=112509 RepID=A0A8I6Y0L8_HORVV